MDCNRIYFRRIDCIVLWNIQILPIPRQICKAACNFGRIIDYYLPVLQKAAGCKEQQGKAEKEKISLLPVLGYSFT